MKLINRASICQRETRYTLARCDASAGQLLGVLAGDVASGRITFVLVVKVNNAGVERNDVAHLVDENLECMLDVQGSPERAGNLVQSVDLSMRFLDLVVGDVRATLTCLSDINFAELNRRLERLGAWLMLEAQAFNLDFKLRQVLDELFDYHRIEVNTGATSQQGPAPVSWVTPGAPATPVPGLAPGVDASFSGAEETPPAAMVDGDPATAWSDAYVQPATALLPQISAARAADWVSLSWSPARRVGGLQAWFRTDARHARPATIGVSAWDGARWRPVTGVRVTWAAAATDPAMISFPAVRTTALRLEMTSGRPETPSGFLGIAELRPTPA